MPNRVFKNRVVRVQIVPNEAQFGIPKQIRTDPGTVFTSEEFKSFFSQFQIKPITCPVRDHRGNGKIERLIRTIYERL